MFEFSIITADGYNMWLFIWLAVMVITLLIEIISVGLTSIWLTGGALVAMFLAWFHAPWWLQIIAFFAVTFILIMYTRPWALKHLESKKIATNYQETIGKTVRITEKVDNVAGTGKADYNGMEWSARSATDACFEVDELAKVVEVRGVKLIIEKQ